jgi:hypothetical protein
MQSFEVGESRENASYERSARTLGEEARYDLARL